MRNHKNCEHKEHYREEKHEHTSSRNIPHEKIKDSFWASIKSYKGFGLSK